MSQKLLSWLDINKEESKFSFWMICYFFFVIATFWVLKPLKKTLFIQFYDTSPFMFLGYSFTGAQAELLAKTANMGVAILALAAFIKLTKRFKGHQLTHIFCAFFVIALLAIKSCLTAGSESAIWIFYLMGDLFSTIMVVSFFAFLNDSVTPSASKRLYGIIGVGGIIGGVVGANFLRLWIDQISVNNWIYISISTIVTIALFAKMASYHIPKQEEARESFVDEIRQDVSSVTMTSTFKTVLNDSYLVKLCILISFYEMVSTIIDFQMSSLVGHYFDGPEIGRFFTTVYSITTWVSLIGQVFLTNIVLRYFGVKQGLLALPMLIAIAAFAFILAPIAAIAGCMVIVDNGLNYSINQSSRETLYVPLPPGLKYMAKGFIDIFVMRLSKVFAIGLSLGLSMFFTDIESIRWLSIFTLILAAVWIRVVYKISAEYQEMVPFEGKDFSKSFFIQPLRRIIGTLAITKR